MLTYAHECSRMLTYAVTKGMYNHDDPMLTLADIEVLVVAELRSW